MPVEIPYPITFNPYKHHFRFLLSEIEKWKAKEWEDVYIDLQKIGSNLSDLYIGNLDVKTVCLQCYTYVQKEGIHSKQDLNRWLDQKGWKNIQLSDESEWMLKVAENNERYLHIHPAKYSKHSRRVRATTLKTVLALQVNQIQYKTECDEVLPAVNQIRKSFLKLSYIKTLEQNSGILRLWQLFNSQDV